MVSTQLLPISYKRGWRAIDYFCFNFCLFEFTVRQHWGEAFRSPSVYHQYSVPTILQVVTLISF